MDYKKNKKNKSFQELRNTRLGSGAGLFDEKKKKPIKITSKDLFGI